MESVQAVEKILNYSFTDKNLLKEAITETSCRNIHERLEFLGDSVLKVVFSNHIHITYPNLSLKELNELRDANVSNEKFARVAVNHKLHQFLILEDPNPNLYKSFKIFAEAVGKEDDPAPYGGLVKAPKVFADLVESIAGAVYVDVNFDLQRVWEIFRVLVEPIYTLDDIRLQPERTYLRLLLLGDKHGKRIEFLYSKGKKYRHVFEVYLGDKPIGSGRSNSRDFAKLLAANKALRKLSECLPIENIVDEDSLHVELEDAKRKLFEICSTEKLRLQTGSSSLPTASENSLTEELTPNKTVIDEDSLHVELEDVNRKLFQICATEKLRLQTESSFLPTASENPLTYQVTPTKMDVDGNSPQPEDVKAESFELCSTEKLRLQTGSSSLPIASENPLTDEMTQEQMVIDEDSPHVEHEDVKRKLFEICSPEKLRLQTESSSLPTASENPLEQMVIDEDSPHVEPGGAKGKLFEIYSTRKLQIQTGSSSLPTASVNPLTYEMTIKQMVVDEDSQEEEPKDTTQDLFQICKKNKWPNPIFSFEEERGPKNEQKFVCSVKIEIPSVQSTFHMKGDAKSTKKQAENSSAYHMIGALKSSLMSLVISNLQIPKSLDEKIFSNESCLPHDRSLELFSSEIDSDSVEAVEKILNYSFTNKNLLREALTHNSSDSFERIMFVGKPALSLAFANHIYLTYPKLEPKKLDLLRIANTCNDRFAQVAIKHGIDQFFKSNSPKTKREIINFIKLMDKEDDPDPYTSVKGPKILVGLVDSVAGAVYIDVNRDVKRLWEILRGLFEPICTHDDLRRQPHPLLTLLGLGYKNGKQIEFRYRESGNQATIAEVYLDDKFIACGKSKKCRYAAKMKAAKMALQKLSEIMPIEMVMNDNIEYEDAKETLIEICNKRKWPNPSFSVESSGKRFVCSVKIETPTEEEGTLYIEGDTRKRRKIAENNAASHMIRTLSSPLRLVIRNLQMQESLEDKKNLRSKKRERQSLDEKGDLQMQNSLDENKKPQMQNSLDENKKPLMQNSLDENKTPQMQNSLDENPQMQNGLDEKKNLLMQNSLDENKNLQMQNSLDENENLHQKKRKRKRR